MDGRKKADHPSLRSRPRRRVNLPSHRIQPASIHRAQPHRRDASRHLAALDETTAGRGRSINHRSPCLRRVGSAPHSIGLRALAEISIVSVLWFRTNDRVSAIEVISMHKRILISAVLLLAVVSSLAQSPSPATPELTRRVDSIIGKMTLDEKIDYIGGTGFAVRALPRLNLPALEMSDGPFGVRSNAKFP